jgi:hypothetical protein
MKNAKFKFQSVVTVQFYFGNLQFDFEEAISQRGIAGTKRINSA